MKKYTITLNRNYLNLFKKTLLKSLIIAFLLLSVYYFPKYNISYDPDIDEVIIKSSMFNDDSYRITSRDVNEPDIKNKDFMRSYIPEKSIFNFFSFQKNYLESVEIYEFSSDFNIRLKDYFYIILPCIFTFKIWTLLFLTLIISSLILSIKYIRNKIEIKVK